MSWRDSILASEITRSPAPDETRRFGVSVSRLVVPQRASPPSLSEVLKLVDSDTSDVVLLRYPADHVDWFAQLLGRGRDVLFADTLVYWRLTLPSRRSLPPVDGVRVEKVSTLPEGVLNGLIGQIFMGYSNHYTANPVFDRHKVLEGYQQWARRSVAQSGPVVLSVDGQPVGLATTQQDQDAMEILLAGVVAEHQNRGLYAHLLAGVEDLAGRGNAAQLVISTQGHNLRVQRAWARYGFEPVAAMVTLHLIREGMLTGQPLS